MDNQVLQESEESELQLTARKIVAHILPDINVDHDLKASEFIQKYWQKYQEEYPSNQSTNGKVFEEMIAIILIRAGIFPFYMQARVAFISYVNYDFIVYSEDIGPIALSVKTSLRERWKQADLEAVALKYIHRKSEVYVISLDPDEVRRRKVDASESLGIDGFILGTSNELDSLISSIKEHHLALAPTVEVVTSNTIITAENYSQRYS